MPVADHETHARAPTLAVVTPALDEGHCRCRPHLLHRDLAHAVKDDTGCWPAAVDRALRIADLVREEVRPETLDCSRALGDPNEFCGAWRPQVVRACEDADFGSWGDEESRIVVAAEPLLGGSEVAGLVAGRVEVDSQTDSARP